MLQYVVRRLAWTAVLIAVITLVTYILFFVVPAERTTFVRRFDSSAADVRRAVGSRGPFYEEYGAFVWRVLSHGSLGRSAANRADVNEIVLRAAPVTGSLLLGGAVVWLALAFPIGILSALRPRSLLDRAGMVLVLIGISAHPVWIGFMLSYVLGYRAHLFPLSGYCDLFSPATGCGGPTQWAYHLLLPWLTFALLFAALYARMIRATVVEVLDSDYVTTARAKGASEWRVIRSHVLPNTLLPLVTMVGMDLGRALGSAVFVEWVFGLPGLGHVVVEAVNRNDFAVVMGVTLYVGIAVCLLNLLVDLAYAVLDPRLQLSRPRRRRLGAPAAPLHPASAAEAS